MTLHPADGSAAGGVIFQTSPGIRVEIKGEFCYTL